MTAPLPNISAVAPTGQVAQPGQAASGAAAGFDAVLAALFGDGGAVTDPALAGLLGSAVAAQPATGLPGETAEGAEGATTEGGAPAVASDSALALIAALVAPAAAPVIVPLTKAVIDMVTDATPTAPVIAELPAVPVVDADGAPELAKTAEAPVETTPDPTPSPLAHLDMSAARAAKPAPTTQLAAPAAAAAQAAPEAPQPSQAPSAQTQAMAGAAAATAEVAEAIAPPPIASREKPAAKTEKTDAIAGTPRTEATAAAGLTPRTGGAQASGDQTPGMATAAPELAAVDGAAVEAAAFEPAAAADGPDANGPGQTASTGATSTPVAPPHVVPVRGSPETVANFAAQILKKLDGRSTRFDVELTPAGLGKVDVRVEIDRHGRVSAAMGFDTPQAAQEMKSRAGELQKTLEQAGFDLSGGMSFDVAGDQGRQGQGLAEQWGERDAGGGSSHSGRAFRAALETAGEADTGAASALNLRRGLRSGVDVRI